MHIERCKKITLCVHCLSCIHRENCIKAIEYAKSSDREALEWLVRWCLQQEDPCITMSRGRELLGLKDMQEMRDFMGGYDGKPRKDNERHDG